MVAELIGFRRPEFTYASSRNPVVTHDRTSVPVLSRLHGKPCRRLLHCTIYSTSPSNPPLIRPYEPGLTGKCCSATLTQVSIAPWDERSTLADAVATGVGMPNGPLDRYLGLVQAGEIEPDPAQRRAPEKLDELPRSHAQLRSRGRPLSLLHTSKSPARPSL